MASSVSEGTQSGNNKKINFNFNFKNAKIFI